mmetsp:Transcript_48522/g.128601  ORF Transcript_48522/g.128601 Transcript_48522/m.128601 type:complete len:206 (+) Transcript_48522:354-971(+)
MFLNTPTDVFEDASLPIAQLRSKPGRAEAHDHQYDCDEHPCYDGYHVGGEGEGRVLLVVTTVAAEIHVTDLQVAFNSFPHCACIRALRLAEAKTVEPLHLEPVRIVTNRCQPLRRTSCHSKRVVFHTLRTTETTRIQDPCKVVVEQSAMQQNTEGRTRSRIERDHGPTRGGSDILCIVRHVIPDGRRNINNCSTCVESKSLFSKR